MTYDQPVDPVQKPKTIDLTDTEIHDSRLFRTSIQLKNLRGLLFCGILMLAFYPAFWILDLYVTPDWILETLYVRSAVSLYTLVVLVEALRGAGWVRENTGVLGGFIIIFASLGIAAMCWMGNGLESKYYSGLNLAFMGTVIFFIFTPRIMYTLLWGLYGVYVAPWFITGMPIEDPVILINNQFFVLGALIICTAGYHFRYQLVTEEAKHRIQQRQMMNEFRQLAQYDALTGLKNRGSWLREKHGSNGGVSETDVLSDERPDRWVVMIDIDHFKQVNDRYGHQAGDFVLRELARLFKKHLRPGDSIARFGGEEFILELNGTYDGEAVAKRLRETVAVQQFEYDGETIPLTVSMGIAPWVDEDPLEDVIGRADRALYRAKHDGRNQVKSTEMNG